MNAFEDVGRRGLNKNKRKRGGKQGMNDYEEELVDVEIAIHRMAMLRCIFSENLPYLSEQIMEDMLTIKTFIEKYYDDKKEVKE